jgi:translation initiation factor 1
MSNDWKERLGVVFSTNPDFSFQPGGGGDTETLPPAKQKLYVSLDKKKRKGKEVTLVEGFQGTDADLKELARILKQKCGVGGSSKDGEIIVQGNFRDKILAMLKDMGYSVKQKGG